MPNDFIQQLIQQSAIFAVLGLIFYIYNSTCLMIIAGKTGTPGGWMAWIPIANMVLLCRIAKRSGAWVLLLLIPFVNIIILFILLMDVARARGKSPALVFLLLIPPVGMLVVPAMLAMGPGGPPPLPQNPLPKVETQSVCPACGRSECVGEEFCGYTGKRISGIAPSGIAPAPPPLQPVAQAPEGQTGPMVKVLAALVLIAGLATTGYSLFSRIFSHPGGPATGSTSTEPVRRASGSMSLFPVDNGTNPSHPVSVVSQNLQNGTGQLKAPAKWLPPGVNGPNLKGNSATSITSAVYQGKPGDPSVDVHVVDMPASSGGAATVTGWIQNATGTLPTGVRVTAPGGQVFEGDAIKTAQITVYVLNNPAANAVVIIYSDDPAGRPTADRLAGNVGNGQGLSDYPQASSSLNLIPDSLSGGLQLESSNSMDTASMVSPDQLKSVVGDTPQAQEWINQAKSYMPATLTSATYRDPSRRPWDVLIGDFGGVGRSWYTWLALKFVIGLSGMQSTDAGYTIDQGDGRVLLQRSGKYILFMRAPHGESVERVSQVSRGFAF